MDSREERQKQADAAFRSSGFGMPKIAPSPIQQEADAAASLVNAKPVAPPPTLWEQVRDSEIGRSYFWGKEDYSRRAKEIADRLQVSPDVVSIAGEESLKRWENTFQTLEMGKRDDEFAQTWSDWNDISQTERAIRVHNYSDVKQTMGVVDNITSGIRQMDAQIKLSAMGNERMELEAKGANTDELDARIQNLQKYIMAQSGDGGIVHDTASQLYMMANQSANSGKEVMIGSLMGAAAGAAAGGVGAIPGFITGAGLGYRAGLFNRMNEMERGLSYLEYRSGGEYGKMSAETAAKAATAVGITNAAIEFASFGMGLKALSLGASKLAGRATATGAQSIIRNAARSIASARSVGEATKIFAKSAGIGVASETAEEVAQQAVSDIAWNVSADPSEGTRKMPVTEIISNAVDAGITAAPAILGMSAVLGAGANVRFVSKAARMLRPDYEIQKEMAVHTVGAQMLRDLEADKQTSALFKKDPELYTKSVQEAADKQGLGAFFVDANALMETEDGRNILNSMVSNNVVSEQALQTAIETEGRLEVPVGVYLQEDFTEQQRAAVDKASAWTQDGATQAEMTAHWENMAASKYAQELQDDIDRMINATDRVLSDKFSAADEADKETIRQVLVANPLDLNAARKTVRKGIVDNIEQTFSDTISVMRTDLADGEIQLIPGRDTVHDQDRMLRASSNPQWYKDFYATHKRRPRIDEFYDIMLDEEEKQVQRYYSNGVIRSEQDYEDALQQIENGRKMVESLRTIDAYKDTFDELQKEKAVSLRMYLSPDEMKVYDDVKKYMDNVGGDAQESAHQAAYLWAKRAKVFTQMMHDMGHADFVATDYLDMHPLFAMNEYAPDAADKMAAQLMQRNGGIAPREYFQNRYGDGGYDGQSMSNRARAAYDLGEKPMSKWTKDEIIEAILDYLDETEAETAISIDEIKALPAWLLRQEFLTYRSWHHTGALYNVTDFYGLDFKALDLPLSHYQEKIEEHKKQLAETKGDREIERQKREVRRERREFEARIKELRKYTKYKTDRGLIAAVDDGRVTLEELEQKEQEEKAKGYRRYTEYKTEAALIKALRNGDITMENLEALRDEKDPKRIAARKLAKAQGKKEWLEVVANDPALFRLLPEQARNDKDVALAALRRGGVAQLAHVDGALTSDPDFITEAVRVRAASLTCFKWILLRDNFALLRRVIADTPRAAEYLPGILSGTEAREIIPVLAKETPESALFSLPKTSAFNGEEIEDIFRSAPKVAELFAKEDINHYKLKDRDKAARYQAVAREFLKAESRIEYFQAAWHGSQHSFGRFDTSAIGTGTGRQAHGWGLYFTQSQDTARRYRDQLVSRESLRKKKTDGSYGQYLILENGKPIDAAAQEAINRRIAAKTLKMVANGRPEGTYFLPELKQVMQQLEEGDAPTNRLIHVLREQIDTIKSNNKISIAAFLRQVPTEEKARIGKIVREAKAAANKEGRRTTIADVLEGIERHAKPLISQRERELADWRALSGLKVNALTVVAPGSLYKVDIPENEVLLDENRPLNEQPETVRKAIAAYYQSRPESYIEATADDLGTNTGEYFLHDVVAQMQREGKEDPKKAASLLLHKFGIEGITYKEYRDGRCFVVFNDEAVRVLERNGQAVGELYQDDSAETQEQPLIAIHNTDAEKIKHIAEMGGIAIPSLGIARADVPYGSFGDITLIAGSEFINPAMKENPTFDADVYSSRYPAIAAYKMEKGAEKQLAEILDPLVEKFTGRSGYASYKMSSIKKSLSGGVIDALGGLNHDETVLMAFAALRGKTQKDLPNYAALADHYALHTQEFRDWITPIFNNLPKQGRILVGFRPNGQRRYKPYTLENIVKMMRGNPRNAEGRHYGIGNLRAVWAKKYKNLGEAQEDRGRIVSAEEMEERKKKLREEWNSLLEKAGNVRDEIVSDVIINYSKNDWENALKRRNITGITADDLERFMNHLTSAPTEYFEVKKQRAVGLDEFYAAIVPKGTTREVRKILRDAGLRVVTYDGKNRNEVLLKTAQQLQKKHGDVLFQRQQERHIRGMTALRDGRQMLFLFRKNANFSTFVHESGHVFLEDLQQMAAQDNAPEWLKKDWQAVKEWTGWKDGADNRAAHEKWARGFEAYVREGNAPSRDLKAVFRRFRRWLVGIYQNLLDLGEIPPESIRNVMDRMLATQEEIDAYTAEKALDTMQDVDTKLAARLAKLKARAAEKVEKDVEAKIRKGVEEVLEDAVESWRTARTEELRKEDIYKHEALAKQFGEDVLNKYYADAAAFEKALEDAGGPLEERLKREEQEQRKAFADELMNPESIRAQVEEYMTGELGQADLLEAETRYIARERNKLAGEYMKQLRKLNDNPQRGNPKRRLHPGELPESPTRDELLAKPDVQVVDVALPENSPLVPSAELRAAQQTRDEAYAAGKRGKSLPDNPYWKEYRAQAKAWLKEHVPDTILNRELGRITVNRKSLDHALNSIRGNGFVRLAILADLENVLANSVVTHVSRVTHGNVTNKKVFIAHGPVRVHGSTYLAKHVIKEAAGGRFYYDTQSTEIKIAEPLASYAGKTTVANDANVLSNFSTISIEEMLKHVKSEDQPLADGYLTEAERLAEVLSYLRSELKGHEGARESVKDAQKQLSKIRQQERAAVQELEREQTLVKQLKESNAEDAEEHAQKLAEMRQKLTAMRKENAAKVQAIKKTAQEEINTRLQGLRDVRDSTQGRLRLIEEQAAQTLRQAPIGESLTWKTYQRKIAYYGTLSSKALVRGDYVQAAEMKERQLYHAYLAKHAVMQEQQVDKDIRRLRENLKRMTRSQQPIRLDTQARYFVHHLMYQLGLTGTDAQAPIDGFEWSSIEELLNPDVAFGMGGDPVVSPALRAMFEADGRNEKTWRQIPFETWEQTVQVLQAVYTAGRRMHDGLAIVRKNGEHVSIADAANELALKLKKRYGEDNRDLRQIRNDMTRADRMGQLAGELVTQLIKPEIIMNRLDGRAVGVKIDDDSFHRFIYDPIARAANRKREMTADAKRTLSRIFERRYSRNEMRTMRQERKYQVGNRKAYTKEEILTAALNWGAAENRKRVLHTFGVDEMTMNAAFGEILTAKDWDTVEKIWQFIDGYYEERSRVLERETGVPLGKVEAVPFTINGRKFDGGYYPIVYDPQLSQKASDMDVANELAKQMSSNAVFGAGLGATKKRQAVVNRELLLSLDVLPRAVNEAILHISMREAVLDVAHLLDHATLAEPLQKVIGQSQYRMLREWVRDTWREELVRESSAEQFANLLRRNATFSVMAYRTTTALLNICNLPMVAHSLGKIRTLQALATFYLHPQRITRKVKEKSSFIAEREENLDRDLARDMKVSGKELSYAGTQGVATKAAEGVYSAKEAVDRFGYYLITKTDLMLSLPTWQAVYEDTVRAEMERGELTAEQIDAEAIAKADEAVRRIWGSGEIQDQAKVQKGRIMKFFTPFYTFFSVVLNAHIEAGYALKDNGNPVPLMSTVLYWLFLQALLETALRGAIDAATGRGPDDDDDWVEYFGKEYLKNFVGTATGGIPGVNIAATLTMNTMLGEYYQGRGSQVVALRVMDELQDLAYAVGSDKRDWIDMGRSASRVGNRLVGFSDTLTDGFWTLLRVTCTESDATWDEAVADIIFDRKAGKAK